MVVANQEFCRGLFGTWNRTRLPLLNAPGAAGGGRHPSARADDLAKVVELSRAFVVLQSRFRAALAALDRYHVGVFILTEGGQVVVGNREAQRILDLADGLSLGSDRRLRVFRTEESARLQSAIRAAEATAGANARTPETCLPLTRRSGADPFLAEICPISGGGAELDDTFAGAYVLVVDPSNTAWVSTRGMATLYGLTVTEAEATDSRESACYRWRKARRIAEATSF